MPKIPTFTARGRPIAEASGVRTGIQVSPTATVAAALLPAADAITNYSIKKRNDRLQEKLSRHDIGNLGVAKPDSTGKVLSTQSNNALRCFEIATGSPLTQEELKATKPSEINPECWEIANPNFDPNIQSDAWKRKNL